MAISYEIVKNKLYDWVVSVVPTGMPVIFWQQNAPRPRDSYVTLFLSNVVSINQDWTADEATGIGVVEMKGDRQFTLQIEAFGGDPTTLLENIRTSLQKQSVLDTLRANDLAFYQSFAINDISSLVDSRFEKRAQMDVLFGIAQIYNDTPGYFSMVSVQEVIQNPNGDVVFNRIVTVP